METNTNKLKSIEIIAAVDYKFIVRYHYTRNSKNYYCNLRFYDTLDYIDGGECYDKDFLNSLRSEEYICNMLYDAKCYFEEYLGNLEELRSAENEEL